MSETLLLRPEDAAERLRISRSAVYQLIQSGEIDSLKIGRSRRIPVAALQHFVERLRAEARGDE